MLSKYKKKSRDLDASIAQTETETKKRLAKEAARLLGRILPSKSEYEHERSLQIVATKGVVQLFNAVADFQTSVVKESAKEQREKTVARTAMINAVGHDKNTGAVGFGNVIEKIKSTHRKWSVLEDADSEGDIQLGE